MYVGFVFDHLKPPTMKYMLDNKKSVIIHIFSNHLLSDRIAQLLDSKLESNDHTY